MKKKSRNISWPVKDTDRNLLTYILMNSDDSY